MLQNNRFLRLARSGRGVLWLNASAFCLAFGLGLMFLAYPFVLKRLGASDTQVGVCFGMYMGVYAIGCMFQGVISHRLHPKWTSQAGLMGIIGIALAMAIVVYASQNGLAEVPSRLILILLFVICSVGFSFYWPIVMGWVSTGVEGIALNKRLGRYNVSWSSGALIGPLIGGWVVERSHFLAVGLVVLSYLVSLLCLSRTRYYAADISAVPEKENHSNGLAEFLRLLWRFRWLAWVGLFCHNICAGAIRSQLGLYMKIDLQLTEISFGIVILVMNLTIFLSLWAAGRYKGWHYCSDVFVIMIILSVLGMFWILASRQLWGFCLGSGLVGLGNGFFYSSHIYYGVSGGRRRSARMAFHELTIAVGFLVGAFAGGYLSDHFGRTTPYRFCLILFAIGIVAQILIWLLGRRQVQHGKVSQIL